MNHLLAIAVGPVQDFIASARRTRDLWFGSEVLSEISRAVAAEVEKYGKLILPAAIDAPNVANNILAELNSSEIPKSVADEAKKAAQREWQKVAKRVLEEYRAIIREDIWNEQVGDVVECYAAWAPLAEGYAVARARVMRLLAGRKNCRDFLPANGRQGVPKSSLDGLRESVLKDPAKEPWPEKSRARLRVGKGEQLDVVGLVKRASGGKRPYPSVSRVAADPWLVGKRRQLDSVIAECEQLGPGVMRELDLSEAKGHPHYADFPFEGSAVYLNRYRELEEESELAKGALGGLADAVLRLGQPNPYLAVMVADGDRMGAALSRMNNADDHRAFSGKLAEFAALAKKLVHKYRGVLVYSGGDDVFAFVPVDKCLDCARDLHDTFADLLKEWSDKNGTRITLSVGIAIGHFLENLEDLREYGRAAEKHAKGPERDGLAIHLHKRGGAPIALARRWEPRPALEKWADAPDTRIFGLAALLNEQLIPSKLATDLSRMADIYKHWHGEASEAVRGDLMRLILAKRAGSGGNVRERLEPVIKRVNDAASLRSLAQELLIARQIATACRQAAGQESRGEE